ncbi:cell division topological specificity factor MinE [Candidatus Poribacteria bacterium]|nr:cell division topological specificity factor MinE [Candidatus Poribacteria bacterium]
MFRWLMKVLNLNPEPKSKSVAKSRLQLILIQDRVGLDEAVMKNLQAELTELLSNYFELDSEHIEIDIQREEQSMALVASIPILSSKLRHAPVHTRARQFANL